MRSVVLNEEVVFVYMLIVFATDVYRENVRTDLRPVVCLDVGVDASEVALRVDILWCAFLVRVSREGGVLYFLYSTEGEGFVFIT